MQYNRGAVGRIAQNSRANRANACALGERAFALKAEDTESWGGTSALSLSRERMHLKRGRENIAAYFLLLRVERDYGTVPFAAAAGVLVVKENHPASATSPAMMPLLAASKTPVKSGPLVSSELATIQY